MNADQSDAIGDAKMFLALLGKHIRNNSEDSINNFFTARDGERCDAAYDAVVALMTDRDTLRAECERLRVAVERVRGCERVNVYDDHVMLRYHIQEPDPEGQFMRAVDVIAALDGPK